MHYETTSDRPDQADMMPGLRAVYEYWNDIRRERSMPLWADFDWMKIPADIIPWCAVVDVHEELQDIVYRFWGTQRSKLQGRDYTGTSIRDVKPDEVARKIWKEYSSVAVTGEPAFFATKDMLNQDGEFMEYHFLRLPFGLRGSVTQILAVGLYEEEEIKKIQNFFGTRL